MPTAISSNSVPNEIEHQVLEAAVELVEPPADGKQAQRADQHHLEPDVEVEQVGGDERAAHAGQKAVDKRQQQAVVIGPASASLARNNKDGQRPSGR